MYPVDVTCCSYVITLWNTCTCTYYVQHHFQNYYSSSAGWFRSISKSFHVVFLQHNTQMMKWQRKKYLQNLHLMKAQTTIKNNTNKNENGMFLKTSTSSSPSPHPPDESFEPLSSSISRLRKKRAKNWDKETARDGWRGWGWQKSKSCLVWVEGCWVQECLSCGVSSVPVCPADVPRSCASDCPFQRSHLQEKISETGSQSWSVCVSQTVAICYAFVTPAGCCSPKFWPFM